MDKPRHSDLEEDWLAANAVAAFKDEERTFRRSCRVSGYRWAWIQSRGRGRCASRRSHRQSTLRLIIWTWVPVPG